MDQNTPWKYKPDSKTAKNEPDDTESPDREAPKAKTAAWEAPEYLDHAHGAGWYASLIAITAALAAVVFLASKDIVAAVTISIVGIIVGFFVRQKPAKVKYEITSSGVSISGKFYSFDNYKSFNLIGDGSLHSVNLFPTKRLAPPLPLYFEPREEKKIVETLGNYLPYDDRKLDGIDRLARRLRL